MFSMRSLVRGAALLGLFAFVGSATASDNKIALIPGGPHPYFKPWEHAEFMPLVSSAKPSSNRANAIAHACGESERRGLCRRAVRYDADAVILPQAVAGL